MSHGKIPLKVAWAKNKIRIIRAAYVLSQFCAVGCAVGGGFFTLFYPPNTHKSRNSGDYYALIFFISTTAAAIAAYTANKFQGAKIGSGHQHNEVFQFPYRLAQRYWKSNLAESAYLIFATALLIVNNYFLLAAVKAAIQTYKNPSNQYPLLPLSTGIEFACLALKFFVDLIFNATNAWYETAEEIKENFTGSKAKPLISRICYPYVNDYCYPFVIFWIKTAGVASHILTDYLGLLLSIRPNWLINLHKISVPAFWLVMGIGVTFSIPLLLVNYVQTLYFEAKESEINLRHLHKEYLQNTRFGATVRDNKHSFLRSLLTRIPSLKKPIHLGFYWSQAALHAGSDVLAVSVFLIYIFNLLKFNANVAVATTAIASAFVFIASAWGTHESEVKTADRHYTKDFADIGGPGRSCFNC